MASIPDFPHGALSIVADRKAISSAFGSVDPELNNCVIASSDPYIVVLEIIARGATIASGRRGAREYCKLCRIYSMQSNGWINDVNLIPNHALMYRVAKLFWVSFEKIRCGKLDLVRLGYDRLNQIRLD